MRYRRNIPYSSDVESCPLKRADSNFATRARPLYEYIYPPQPMLHSFPGGGFRGSLSREGRALSGSFEAGRPGTAPCQKVTLEVSKTHYGVVEGGLNKDFPLRDELPLSPSGSWPSSCGHTLSLPSSSSAPTSSHGLACPPLGSRVGLGALAPRG
jgi:hypothetical protein